MQLFQLTKDFLDAMNALSAMEEEGAIKHEFVVDTLEGLSMEWDDKALSVAKYILGIEAEAAAVKEAEKRLADRRKALESKADGLRQYLTGQLIATDRFPSDSEVVISFRKSEAVIIDDESLIPQSLKKHIPESWSADKVAIKAALKDGDVPGAHIESRKNLQIK